ncbi:PH domain-containing protein [Lentibacillus sediminis]|uniref:PH domain-containing protein n=1 Tax=Lentibacillus sediminis TaxID=1940529 RepID=UPI000C1C59A2|nr:PH domain-containing protein [Lentibacillus sediminis]
MYFVSKKDTLYFIVIWGTVIFLSQTFIFRLESAFGGVVGFIIIGYLIWIWFGTGYKIEGATLKVQFGGFKWETDIEEIKTIRKVKNPFSAPALAMDRLEILYGKYDVMTISPKNEDKFIELLLNENPQIQIEEKRSKY